MNSGDSGRDEREIEWLVTAAERLGLRSVDIDEIVHAAMAAAAASANNAGLPSLRGVWF